MRPSAFYSGSSLTGAWEVCEILVNRERLCLASPLAPRCVLDLSWSSEGASLTAFALRGALPHVKEGATEPPYFVARIGESARPRARPRALNGSGCGA